MINAGVELGKQRLDKVPEVAYNKYIQEATMIINKITDVYYGIYLKEDDPDYDSKWDFFCKRCSHYGSIHQPIDVDAAFYFYKEDWQKLWKSRSKKLLVWALKN